ncbi:MAG TPA: nuclear transport factor 2 family protein [Verrucomicrobiae bacterium]|jgi:ketosteroid isomerase-like protein|nr:nuclear transport factor 2 family protein [Verrucomicrobiae bacterium]
MTRRRMAAVVLAVLACFGIAWRAARSVAASENAEEEVLKADEVRNDALQKGDVAALEHIYSDDVVYANATGALLTKQQHLADLKARTLHFISFKHEDVKATVHGDTGLVTGISKSEVEYKGSISKSNRRFLNVFSKRDGRWLCVGHFETNISDKE